MVRHKPITRRKEKLLISGKQLTWNESKKKLRSQGNQAHELEAKENRLWLSNVAAQLANKKIKKRDVD
jgi:hypothetical protein